MTLDVLVGKFLDAKRNEVRAGTVSQTTLNDYRRELLSFMAWMGEQAEVEHLGPTDFLGHANHLLLDRELRAGTRKKVLAYIKAMFRWGAANDFCPLPKFGTSYKAPSTTKEAVRKEKMRAGLADHSERLVTGVEIERLLSLASPQMRVIILLGINCGLGPADIARLRWENIDMKSGRLYYPRHKTGVLRVGYLWKRTREALSLLPSHDVGLVLLTRAGRPYYREEGGKVHSAIPVLFRRLTRKLGLTGLTFYRLRHTFKTLGKKAVDRDALNLMMGHKSHSVEARYDHEDITPYRIKRVALKVKARLFRPLKIVKDRVPGLVFPPKLVG